MTRPGGYAELAAVPVDALLPLGGGLSHRDAAAVQVAFSTAWHVLITRGGLRPGQIVLVHAAGSGIGSAALQIAAMAGATIVATASSDEKLKRAAAYTDLLVNYSNPGWREQVMELTAGEGVDVVMSHVGGDEFLGSLEVVKDDGMVVVVGGHSGEVVPLDLIPFFRRQVRLAGSSRATRHEIEQVLDLAARGVFRPQVHSVHPLSEISTAHEELASRTAFGKVLVEP